MRFERRHGTDPGKPWQLVFVIPVRVASSADLDRLAVHMSSIFLESCIHEQLPTRIVPVLMYTRKCARRVQTFVDALDTRLPWTVLQSGDAADCGWLWIMENVLAAMDLYLHDDAWLSICEPFMLWNGSRHLTIGTFLLEHPEIPIARVSNNIYPSRGTPVATSIRGVAEQVLLELVDTGLSYLLVSSYVFQRHVMASFVRVLGNKRREKHHMYGSMFAKFMYRSSRTISCTWSAYFPVTLVSPFDRGSYQRAINALRATKLLATDWEWAAINIFVLFYQASSAEQWDEHASLLGVKHISYDLFRRVCKHPLLQNLQHCPRWKTE